MKRLIQTLAAGLLLLSYNQGEAADKETTADQNAYPDFSLGTDDEGRSQVFQVVIDPRHRTELNAEVPSPVSKINKRIGDSFKKGDILIQLNDTIYKSNINKAMAALSRAETELDAKKQLFKDNVASLFELKEAESNVATAKADLAFAQKNLDATMILAPYDGKVVSLNIEEAELPQTGKTLIEIIDDKVLIAKILVPSTLLPKIQVGTDFQINVKEIGKAIDAKISRIGSVIDPSSGTIRIESDIDNEDGKLVSGMSGRAHFNEADETK